LQGFDVSTKNDSIETNLGVAPLQPRPITTEDEVDVEPLLAHPMM